MEFGLTVPDLRSEFLKLPKIESVDMASDAPKKLNSVGMIRWVGDCDPLKKIIAYQICLDAHLESHPMFRKFVMIHEFTHYLDIELNLRLGLTTYGNINRFINRWTSYCLLEEVSKISHVLEKMFERCPVYFKIPLDSGIDPDFMTFTFDRGMDSPSEQIANFVAALWIDSDMVCSELPNLSGSFIECLERGYYNPNEHFDLCNLKIFKHILGNHESYNCG